MMRDLTLPTLAESVVEGEILAWLVEEGDIIEEGQPVLEVMTDKVTVELPAPFGGKVIKRMVSVGDIVPVHGVLAQVEEILDGVVASKPETTQLAPSPTPDAPTQESEAEIELDAERSIIEGSAAHQSDPNKAKAAFAGFSRGGKSGAAAVATKPAPAAPQPVAAQPTTKGLSETTPAPGQVRAVPSARRLARELGISIAEVLGSGPNGRVRSGDVHAHASAPASAPVQVQAPAQMQAPLPAKTSSTDWPPPAPPVYRTPAGYENRETRTPLRGVRRATSQGLLAATLHSAQTHTIEELDCTGLMALRDELKADAQKQGVKLSYLPFFLKAASLTLREFPAVNSSLDTASGEVVYKDFVHLGMAVNTEGGLVVPVIRDVDRKGLLTLAREISELAEKARSNTLKPAEMSDATFTVSNIGSVGSMMGVPIVSPPAAGIMSVHSIVKRAVVVEENGADVIAIRPMMYLTLSFDHRLVDGADAARFLKKVLWLLEKPSRLVLGD
ncbi:2-oxo acid dehydrogenase subunit E2 [Deinococcus detaillensis]|uniref:Dihydrolipoamide acetyltransferase component of pyruvate dehydrogenase complex n=2 Tax=Deinococcus detaillensis TaxID=2592048 RepID=A0A553V5C4_9DEIO|nr:2-oxo acid dehydrogenase subunit E2 [Deinococcus detaillensis]